MARTKVRWQGRILRNMFRDGGSLVVMARLDHDPERVVELRVPRSSVMDMTKTMIRQAELETPENNGKHAAEDAF